MQQLPIGGEGEKVGRERVEGRGGKYIRLFLPSAALCSSTWKPLLMSHYYGMALL